MMTLLRRHRQWLMIVIAILAIPFVFYFVQRPDYGALHSDQFGRIYNRNITRIEFQRNARLFSLARELGMFAFLQDLVGNASTETEAYAEFTCNRLILQHEAEHSGIQPTSSEIANVVRTFRPFQGESGFDINKYNEFTQNALPSLGFNEAQIEELAADQISLNRVKELVGSGINVPEAETRANYQQAYGRMEVAVVRFRNQDFARDVTVTDEDVTKYFEAHKAQLQTDEKRKVEFIIFGLTEEQKKLAGKARIDVLQKLADRANDFTQALLEKGSDFKQTAAKFQAPVRETADFTAAAPDPLLKGSPQLASAALQLTPQEPNSDAVQTPDGFYIMHLAGITPARPLTLEEAKPKIVESLKAERSHQLVANKAAEATRQIREKMTTGATAEAAIQQTGFKAEQVPPFSLLENPYVKPEQNKETKETPDLASIKEGVAELNPGEVSEFIPSADGGLIAVLEKREPIDETKFAQGRVSFDSRYLDSMRKVVFYEWLRDRRREAGFQVAPG
jgi:peptidyl-prolyl cis-trans isomerase D